MAAGIQLVRVTRQTAIIPIRGTAPLIVHAFSVKSKREMLDKHKGKRVAKQVKNPKADFEATRYKFDDGSGDGFPAGAFKSATVRGGQRLFGKAVKMTDLRQNLTFLADGTSTDGMPLTRIDAEDPMMREDMVRVGMNAPDIRHRAEYREWEATIRVEFIPDLIDIESVTALVDAGGQNGVGDWRPEKNGSFGTYEVVTG